MNIPYFPAGQANLPAQRAILFADGSNLVQRLDESARTLNGLHFVAFWDSPMLNMDQLFEYTLRLVSFRFAANADSSVTVRASHDGGHTWGESKSVKIVPTHKGIGLAQVPFNITGHNLKIRFVFDNPEPVNIFSYVVRLNRRGDLGKNN